MAKYDKDVDYQALINEAVEKKDYKAAAQYEQQRNEKINDLNASGSNKYNATTTSNYAGWLDNTDYGTIGKEQMASGASWQDVLQTYENRYNKAANTVGLTQYANDDVQKEMWDYITSNMQTAAGYTMPTYSYDAAKPTYTSNYQTRIDEMLNQILNREDFSYNVEDDQLYQQYKTQYNREGNRAMNDTLAAAASGAGGMNSYAMTAAQQANNYYATQLGDKIPELYQLAYEMYLTDIDNQVRDLGLLQDMDDTQYNRYRDTMSDWYNDRDFAYNQYRDSMGDYQWGKQFEYNASQDAIDNAYRQEQADIANQQWQTNFDYNVGRDQVADQRYDQEWEYNVGRDEIADNRYNSETAYNKAMELLNAGAMPDAAMLAEAGITEGQAANILAYVQAQYNKSLYGSSGSGGHGGGSGGNDTGRDTGLTEDMVNTDGIDPPVEKTPTFSNYEDAAAYLKKKGADVGGLMTKSEWSRRKSSYEMYGQGGTEAVDYKTYDEYLNAYVEFSIENKGK